MWYGSTIDNAVLCEHSRDFVDRLASFPCRGARNVEEQRLVHLGFLFFFIYHYTSSSTTLSPTLSPFTVQANLYYVVVLLHVKLLLNKPFGLGCVISVTANSVKMTMCTWEHECSCCLYVEHHQNVLLYVCKCHRNVLTRHLLPRGRNRPAFRRMRHCKVREFF